MYKRLAASIYQCISSGDMLRSDSEDAVMHETCSLKQKDDECNYKLVREKGSELINVSVWMIFFFFICLIDFIYLLKLYRYFPCSNTGAENHGF